MGIFFNIDSIKNNQSLIVFSGDCENLVNEALISFDKGISIHVTPDKDRVGGEAAGYFKVCDGKKCNEFAAVRIRFAISEYVFHYSDNGKKKLKNKAQKKLIMEMLNRPISEENLSQIANSSIREYIKTEWQYAIYRHNLFFHVTDEEMIKYSNSNIDLKGIGMHTRMVKLNHPMPDYTKLK